MCDRNSDRPAKECAIEITPEMIDAGVKALGRWHPIDDSKAWIVEDVFEEMLRAKQSRPTASGCLV